MSQTTGRVTYVPKAPVEWIVLEYVHQHADDGAVA